MAKKATSSTTSGAAGKGGAAGKSGAAGKIGATGKAGAPGKSTGAKPRASKSTAVARPAKARSSAQGSRRSGTEGQGAQDRGFSASEALMKLLESPLMADLLTVAATAALAAIAGGRLRGAVDPDDRSTSVVRAAAKAALAAIGRRLAQEVDEIREVARKARDAATE